MNDMADGLNMLPRPGEPELATLPGMAAPAPRAIAGGRLALLAANMPDTSIGAVALQEPARWTYDFDPASGIARATYVGEVAFTGGGPGVTSFNSRAGAVTLQLADLTTLPAIVSFDGRTGAVSLTAADVSGVGGMLGFVITTQFFAATGTYTPPSGLVAAIVEVVGGGGSGGPVVGAASRYGGAGGGGSGGYSRSILTAAQIGASQPALVGAGGVATTTAGQNGTVSQLGPLVIALGGSSGYSFDGSANLGARGLGAGIGTGTVALPGSAGQSGFAGSGNTYIYGGSGGAIMGGGVSGPPLSVSNNWTGTSALPNTGAGGVGAATNNFAANAAGGNGGSGWILVTEFSRM
jgi:hypothetical protein